MNKERYKIGDIVMALNTSVNKREIVIIINNDKVAVLYSDWLNHSKSVYINDKARSYISWLEMGHKAVGPWWNIKYLATTKTNTRCRKK